MKTLKQLQRELYKEKPQLKAMVEAELEQLKISEELKAARNAAGMTQAEVAEKMNVNRTQITQLEGHPKNITLATLVKYTRAVGGTLNIIIEPPKRGKGGAKVKKIRAAAAKA